MASPNDPIVGTVNRGGAATPGVYEIGTPDLQKGQLTQAQIDNLRMRSGKFRPARPDEAAKYGQRFGEVNEVTNKFTPSKGPTLSAREQTDLMDAENAIQRQSTLARRMKRAFELNDTAYGGRLAWVRKAVGDLVESKDPGFVASQELDNLMSKTALDQLKETFPGAISDAESQIMLRLQGNTTSTPEVRARIWQNALPGINTEIQRNARRIQAIKGGYYQRAGLPAAAKSATPAAVPKSLKVISVED